jgi:hypothetical protein
VSGITLVRRCRAGDQIGNGNRTLYTFVSDPVVTHGAPTTVAADLVVHPLDGDAYFETRTWLHPNAATVHVRERSLSEYDDTTRPWDRRSA